MSRVTVIAVATIVAIASAVALVQYVGGAEERATATAEPVPVLVAAADVADGTPFTEAWESGAVVRSETMRALLPPTATVDPEALQGSVADGVIHQGQILVEGLFVDPSQIGDRAGPPTFADQLPEGSVAVSFEASGVQAVANLISPGDRVNLLVKVPNAAELGLPDSGGPAVVHVFQGLRVIAIGEALAPSEGADAPVANPGSGSYTVAVAPRDAARLLFLTREYEVLLALVGPETEATEQAPVSGPDALPETLTPRTGAAGEGGQP